MQEGLRDLLERRRNRACAIILGVKERECDAILREHPKGNQASEKFRKVVLDQLNEYHDLVVDVFESLDPNGAIVLNELYLTKLDEIHSAVVRGGG